MTGTEIATGPNIEIATVTDRTEIVLKDVTVIAIATAARVLATTRTSMGIVILSLIAVGPIVVVKRETATGTETKTDKVQALIKAARHQP